VPLVQIGLERSLVAVRPGNSVVENGFEDRYAGKSRS
jgi:hypothetical protein